MTLYHRDEPVLLHDGATYREELSRSLEFERNNYDIPIDLKIESRKYDAEFEHGYTGCMAFLRTCRQIYHEVAGILYGSNTFLFSRVLDQDCHRRYTPTKSASTWISYIDGQISLVSTILIDFDATCPDDLCQYDLDILPILRVKCASPGSAPKIMYAHKARRLHTTSDSQHMHHIPFSCTAHTNPSHQQPYVNTWRPRRSQSEALCKV